MPDILEILVSAPTASGALIVVGVPDDAPVTVILPAPAPVAVQVANSLPGASGVAGAAGPAGPAGAAGAAGANGAAGAAGAAGSGLTWVSLTQAAYTALGTKNPDTIYDLTDVYS